MTDVLTIYYFLSFIITSFLFGVIFSTLSSEGMKLWNFFSLFLQAARCEFLEKVLFTCPCSSPPLAFFIIMLLISVAIFKLFCSVSC